MKHAIGFSRLRCLTAAVMMACCASVFAAKMDTAGVAPTAKVLPKPIELVPHSGFDVAAVQQAVVRDTPGETVAVRDDAVQMAIGGGPRAGGALVYDCSDPGITQFQPLGCPGPGGGSGVLWADDVTLDAAGTRDLNHFDTMITCGVTGAVATGYSLDLELWEDVDTDGLPDTAIAGTACSFTLPDPPVGTTQTNTIFTCDKVGSAITLPEQFWIVASLSSCGNTLFTGPRIGGLPQLGSTLNSYWIGPPSNSLFFFGGGPWAGLWNQVYTGPHCDLAACPGGGQIEAEACGDNWPDGSNGGCNTSPAAFEAITPGVPVCGTAWAYFDRDDSDWYKVTVTDGDGDSKGHIDLTAEAELPVALAILDVDPNNDGDCGPDGTVVYAELFLDPSCTAQATSACVPVPAAFGSKDYVISVSAGDCFGGIGAGYNCGTSNDYQFTVTTDDNCAVTGACCSSDGLGTCSEVTSANCSGIWHGEGTTCVGSDGVICRTWADFCTGGLPLPLNGTVYTNNTLATPVDLDPVNPPGGNDPELPAGSPTCHWNGDPTLPHNTIWYTYTADASGSLQISLCSLDCGALQDSGMALYSGSCGSLVQVACAEDECPGGAPFWRSRMCALGLTPSQTYYLAIYNSGGSADSVPGELIIEIETPCPAAPAVGGCCVTDGLGGYSCVDGLVEADCDAVGGRFGEESQPGVNDGCAVMSPPCGVGACCSDVFGPSLCSDGLDQATCEGQLTNGFGEWYEGLDCNPPSFPEPCTGQCCIGGACDNTYTDEADCTTNGGGTWTEGPTCTGDPSHCQTACAINIGCQKVSYPTGGRTSDIRAGLQVADNFQPTTSGSVTEVCWWGFYFDFIAETDCPPQTERWTITYYNDDAGGTIPGTPIVSHVVVPTKVATGYLVTSNLATEYRYDATHPAVAVTGNVCYWIEITNDTGAGSTCFWLWDNSSRNGDLAAAQTAVPGPYAIGDEIAEDLAFCLDVATYTTGCPPVPPVATEWRSHATHDRFGNEGPPSSWEMVIAAAVPPRVGPPDPRTDTQIEPRFYSLGASTQPFHEVRIDLGAPATVAVTVNAVCTDTSTHGATVTVSSDGLTVVALFEPALPNTECCTMTLGGGASGSQVIKILFGDVNGSGRVNATDKSLVKGKITTRTPPLAGDDFFFDVNMSGRINATDKSLVKGKITTTNELDQSSGCGLP